jgi:hypothetical protein
VRGAIEFAVDGFVFGHVADEFIIHKTIYDFLAPRGTII